MFAKSYSDIRAVLYNTLNDLFEEGIRKNSALTSCARWNDATIVSSIDPHGHILGENITHHAREQYTKILNPGDFVPALATRKFWLVNGDQTFDMVIGIAIHKKLTSIACASQISYPTFLQIVSMYINTAEQKTIISEDQFMSMARDMIMIEEILKAAG